MAQRQERQPPGRMPSVVMSAAAAAAAIAIALEKEAGEEEHAGRHMRGQF